MGIAPIPRDRLPATDPSIRPPQDDPVRRNPDRPPDAATRIGDESTGREGTAPRGSERVGESPSTSSGRDTFASRVVRDAEADRARLGLSGRREIEEAFDRLDRFLREGIDSVRRNGTVNPGTLLSILV